MLLPTAAFGETAGTYVNVSGDWQSFRGAVAPPGEARPGWKILRVLGNLLELTGFDYNSAAEIRAELESHCVGRTPDNRLRGELDASSFAMSRNNTLMRIGNVPIYATDLLVRYAPSLQCTPLAEKLAVRMHPSDAKRLGFKANEQVCIAQGLFRATATVILDHHVAKGCVRIPAAVQGSETLGAAIGPVTLDKV